MSLKRQFKIENGTLKYYFDSNLVIDDNILMEELSKNSTTKMHDIVSTIQKEQNVLIRSNDLHNLIVQGVAGSGKTSVAMHRVSYLLYKYRETLKNEDILIGKVGEKTNKGKHTTKYVKLYSLQDNTYILDTPGFSSYELYDIDYKNLPSYYPEFKDIKCDYEDCMHVNEDISVCRVKKLVKEGIIDKKRYERYVYIYNKLKELDDKKYKR